MDNSQPNQPQPTPPPTTHEALGVHAPATPQPPNPPAVSQPPHADSPRPEQHPNEPSKKPSSVSNAPKLVIVVAVFVTLSLVAMAVMAYRQKDAQTPKPQVHQDTERTTTPAATTEDIDTADQAVDEALDAADMTEELPEDDLQNQTLGL